MKLASLTWNSEMHCIVDIVEHHTLNLPTHCSLPWCVQQRRTSHPTPWSNQVWASRPCRQSSHPLCSPRRTTNLPKSWGRCWRDWRKVYNNRGTRWSTKQESQETAKMIAFWTCVWRILMHHPTFIGNRSSPFPWARRRNTCKTAWTNAVTFLPLWFHVMECLETKPR